MSDSTTGSVYIFNAHTETAAINLNQIDISDISGAPTGDYSPIHIAIQRTTETKVGQEPLFYTGNNRLAITWPDSNNTPQIRWLVLRPPTYSVEKDVYVYLFRNHMVTICGDSAEMVGG